jgi:hypothetical protein
MLAWLIINYENIKDEAMNGTPHILNAKKAKRYTLRSFTPFAFEAFVGKNLP